MSIGTGIALFVIGAIMAFAIDPSIGGGFVSLNMIGYILMIAGAIVFVLGLVFTLKKKKNISTVRHIDSSGRESMEQRESNINDSSQL